MFGGGHGPVQLSAPPSKVTTVPSRARPAGVARSAISQPNSSIRPRRCNGTLRAAPRRTTSGYLRSDSVSKRPIAAATKATSGSRAESSRVSASTAARAAPVCAIAGIPWCGETVMFTTMPEAARSAGNAASVIAIVPSTFSRITADQPFAVIDSAGTKYWPPALLTSRSSDGPAAAAIPAADDGSRMSPTAYSQPSSEDASRRTSSVRPAMTTRAPHATSSAAAWRPRFVPPPVTTAVRTSSSPSRKMLDVCMSAGAYGAYDVGARMPATLAERLAWRDEQHFVGREPELAFFDSLLVEEPSHQVVLVHGPGGIGKSTLLREFARRAEKRGYRSTLVEGRKLAPVPGEIEHALGDIASVELPLIMFDTYERMSAASAYLRHRLLPSLPARSLVILAGRKPPEPEWFQGGWERLATELELRPLNTEDARKLCAAHGLTDTERCDELIAWAEGSPLAISLAAASGGDLAIDDPNVVRVIIRRLAQTELDGGNLDVAAVAALARCVNARMLRDVLPGVDPEEAEAWLRSRSFAEPLRDGVTLHDLVRRAVRSDLRRRDPEHERELRRRIADHLHARALRGEPRLVVDLAELLENQALRWGFGADGSVRYRVDEVREGDSVAAAPQVAARSNNGEQWWKL